MDQKTRRGKKASSSYKNTLAVKNIASSIIMTLQKKREKRSNKEGIQSPLKKLSIKIDRRNGGRPVVYIELHER